MPWGDNGVTTRRILIDQSQAPTVGAAVTRLQTQALNQVGYLRGIWIDIPFASASISLATSGVAAQAETQRGAARLFQSVALTAQGIAPLYQLTKGFDFEFLEYVGNGDRVGNANNPDISSIRSGTAIAFPDTQVFGAAAASRALVKSAFAGTWGGGLQPVTYAYHAQMPLTEWVKFPASVTKNKDGSIVQVAATEAEVGLVTLQNTQQNVIPSATLNPIGSTTASPEQVFVSGGAAVTAGLPIVVNWFSDFYDVPGDPANQPPPYSQMFVVTRQSTDDPVTGQKVTHRFQPAGLLMRAIYIFTDTNGLIVDLSNAGASNPQVTFLWGATVDKFIEPLSLNLTRAYQDYGDFPPAGCFIHDFFVDHTLTDLPNTAALTSVQAQFINLPASITNLHTIEVRLLPVRLRG
jgi:hypothetical protein